MRLQMSTQIRAIGERTLAVGALIWLFPSMRANMALKQPRTAERFAADRAFTRQRVRAYVHFQRAQ